MKNKVMIVMGVLSFGLVTANAYSQTHLNSCGSVIEAETFMSTISSRYIVRTTGIMCMPIKQ